MEGSVPTGPFWLVKRSVRLLPSMLATLMLSPSVQYSFLQGEDTVGEGPWCQQPPAPSQPCRAPHLIVTQPREPHSPLSHPQEGVWGLPKPCAHLDWHTLVGAHLPQPTPLHTHVYTHTAHPSSPVTVLLHADTQRQTPFSPPPHTCTVTRTPVPARARPSCQHHVPPDSPPERVHHQAVGLVQPLDHGVLEGAIQPGHIDLLLVGIVAGPEEVSGNPIHGEAVSVGQVCKGTEMGAHQL